jgi:hypothetical protein
MPIHDETINEYCADSAEFKTWLQEVDRLVTIEFGIGVFDLPDRLWRDMFESEMSAKEAAQETISNPWNN